MVAKNQKHTARLSPNKGQRNLVAFHLGKQVYAIPIDIIIQIIEMVTITPIPQVDPVVAGAINVRGEALPVINLRRYLGLPECDLDLHTPIILVQVKTPNVQDAEQKLGLIVDEVIDVLGMLDDQITPLPDMLPENLRNAPIVQGLVHTSYGMVLLLNLHNLFASHTNSRFSDAHKPSAAFVSTIPSAVETRHLLAEVEV